ncbi:MAG: hypothetical protein KF847_20800 [Pirellulales bacterium]|nr:hypothetical protein [Pirellulales bacterium]
MDATIKRSCRWLVRPKIVVCIAVLGFVAYALIDITSGVVSASQLRRSGWSVTRESTTFDHVVRALGFDVNSHGEVESIVLHRNLTSTSCPSSLTMRRLRNLIVSGAQGSENDLPCTRLLAQLAGRASKLDSFVIHGVTAVTDKDIRGLVGHGRLRTLHLGTSLVSDDTLKLLSECRNLRRLEIPHSRVSSLVGSISQPSLEILDLSWTDLDDSGIIGLDAAVNLQTLKIAGTRISDKAIATIVNLRRLGNVDVSATEVTPAGLMLFEGHEELFMLGLRDVKISVNEVVALSSRLRGVLIVTGDSTNRVKIRNGAVQ